MNTPSFAKMKHALREEMLRQQPQGENGDPMSMIALKRVSLHLLLAAVVQASVAQAPGSANDGSVASKALQIVSSIHGTWTQMPGDIATDRMTGGALIGNGSVGVAIGGTADRQQYYIGRN